MNGAPNLPFGPRAKEHILGRIRSLWERIRAAIGGQAHPWMLISLLVTAGWLVDSFLAAYQMHRAGGGDLSVHLYHFWYLPPLIGIALWLSRKRLRLLSARVVQRPTLETLTHTLPSQSRKLAVSVLSSDAMSGVLALLKERSGSAMTAHDLALMAGRKTPEVEEALGGLQALGLVEAQCACDLTFYRLTSSTELLACLNELEAWRADWLGHAGRLAEAAGGRLTSVPLGGSTLWVRSGHAPGTANRVKDESSAEHGIGQGIEHRADR